MTEPAHPAAEASEPVAAPGLSTVLVGLDERPASADAVTLARALAAPDGARLVLASVRPYWPDLIGAENYERALAEDEGWVRRAGAELLGDQPFSTYVVGGGHQTDGLKEIAVAEGADLIVLGSTHRGRLGRVLPGSVGERVLNNAPCAVAIAPLGLAATGLRLRRVAVGYDGSKEARVALHTAATLARGSGAALRIIGAVDIELDTLGLQPQTSQEREDARMRRRLAEAKADVAASVRAETQLLRGAARRVLLEAAGDADLLVLGSRGHYGRVRRLLPGSVATAVTRDAPCATLITPAA